MKRSTVITTFLSCLFVAFLASGPAMADETKVSLEGRLTTQLHLRNDSDFDPTDRYYDVDGQTEGQAATFFAPRVSIDVPGRARIVYGLELGWNAWSRNNPGQPNQFGGSDAAGLMARHKALYAAWSGDSVSITAGYQELVDPSGLFLDNSTGAVTLGFGPQTSRLTLIVGQLADTTYEGLDIRSDNFVTDSALAGVTYRRLISTKIQVDAALYSLLDNRSIDRPLQLNTAVAGVRVDSDTYQAWAHVVGQYGIWTGAAVGGGDQTIAAYAVQLGTRQRIGKLNWGLNLVALSPDDDDDGNDAQGAFFGAGKNRSPSVLLSEDEQRDRYDNLDERIGTQWGPFAVNPAGLTLYDVSLGYEVTSIYKPRLVLAGATNLNPNRAFDARFVGAEVSVLNRFELSSSTTVYLNALVFLPGEAAAVFVNDVDRTATELLYGGALGLTTRF